MAMDEAKLREKLSRIEALFAGALEPLLEVLHLAVKHAAVVPVLHGAAFPVVVARRAPS